MIKLLVLSEYHNLICMFESYFMKDTSNMQSDTIILTGLFLLLMLKMVYPLDCCNQTFFFSSLRPKTSQM